MSTTALRFGILGTAGIAAKFVSGARGSAQVHIAAVASRELARAQHFAQQQGIEQAYDSYDALLARPELDAIYIPLPNTLHGPWVLRALQAGKHVLCEKPLAMSAAEAQTLFATARRVGRHLVEGYPYRYQPITAQLRRMLAAGDIGRVTLIQASIGFTLGSAPDIRLSADLGGGALLDAGCYPISLVRMVANACPVRVQASARWRSAGIDDASVAQFEFADGLLAQTSCSFSASRHRQALIIGTLGSIEAGYANHPQAGRALLRVRRGATLAPDAEPACIEAPALDGFRAEVESFCDLVRQGPMAWQGTSPEESIDIARMLDATRRSCLSGCAEPIAG